MKKKYLLFLVAACLLAGCGTDKPESQNENKKIDIDAYDLLWAVNFIWYDPYEDIEINTDKLISKKDGMDYMQNDDGTYTFNGEQYKNMLELSGDLGDAHLECRVLTNDNEKINKQWFDVTVRSIELCGVHRDLYMEFADKNEAVEALKEKIPDVFEKIQKKFGYKTIDDNNWKKFQTAYNLIYHKHTPGTNDSAICKRNQIVL